LYIFLPNHMPKKKKMVCNYILCNYPTGGVSTS